MKNIRMLLLMEARLRNQFMRPRLQALGLTPGQGQARILDAVREREHLSQKELAEACRMDVTTMSRNIDRLVESGLLVREVNPDSRRAHCIALTEEGSRKAEEAHLLLERLDHLLTDGLTEEEQQVFCRVMQQICQNLEQALEDWI